MPKRITLLIKTKQHLVKWINKYEILLPLFQLMSYGKVLSQGPSGCKKYVQNAWAYTENWGDTICHFRNSAL